MKVILKNCYLFLLIILVSCGGQEIIIKSVPDQADVYIKSLGQVESEKIGQTPITLDQETIYMIIM